MWECPKCKRVFDKEGQVHTCETKPLAEHFKNRELAKEIFDVLVKKIGSKVGKIKIVSIPCCIHLFGQYDFLAALPKKDRLEIRFSLPLAIKSKRLKQAFPVSQTNYKNCFDIFSQEEIDNELLSWIRQSYYIRDLL